jgi:hypothetical protein
MAIITYITTTVTPRQPYRAIWKASLVIFNAALLAIIFAALMFIDHVIVPPGALAPYRAFLAGGPTAGIAVLIWTLGDGALLIIGVLLPGTRTIAKRDVRR